MNTLQTRLALRTALSTLLCTLCAVANAQTASPADVRSESVSTAPKISADALGELKNKVANNSELDAERKQRLLNTVQKASDALNRALKVEAMTPANQRRITEIPGRVEEIRAELDAPVEALNDDIDGDRTLSELTAALASRQPHLEEARLSLEALDKEHGRQLERRATIVGDQATHAKRRAEIENELKTVAPAEESPLATAVRRALLFARLREVTAEGPAHQAELSYYDALQAADLTQLQTQLQKRHLTRLVKEVGQLKQLITEKRSEDARYIAQQLADFAAGNSTPSPYANAGLSHELFEGSLKNSLHLKTAEETANLAKENVSATNSLTLAAKELSVAQTKLSTLRATKARIDKTLKRVGLSGAIGLELRRLLRTLDDTAVLRQKCRTRQETMRDLEFRRLDFEDKAVPVNVRLKLLQDQESLSDASQIEFRLMADRSSTLTALQASHDEYFNRLLEIDAIDQERVGEVEEFRSFIQEMVLWIRSNRFPEAEDATEIGTTAVWFLSPHNWTEVGRTLWEDAKSHLGLYVLISILVSLLFLIQPRFRRSLTEIGAIASRPSCREFNPTSRAAVLTVLIAVSWAILPGFLSWRLLSDVTASPFALAVGRGLMSLAFAFVTLSLLRTLCRPAGLGLAHFGWPTHSVKLLRSQIHTMMIAFLPLLFAAATLHAHENPQGRDALERLLFVVSLLVLAWFLLKIAHPRNGIARDYLSCRTDSWVFRTRWLLYALIVGVPLTLGALAIAGYYYTAYELSWRLHVSIWVVISLLVLRAFLVRWFVVNQRRLHIEQTRQRRQTLLEEQNAETLASNIPKPSPVEEEVDLKEIGDQTQRFIDSGLALLCAVAMWFVWVNVLPALGVLDTWEMWPTTVDATVEFTDQNGVKTMQTEPRLESITVADGLIAIMLIFLTATAARNVPGLLELTVLQRLPMEPASRYATKMVARYLIVVLGAVAAAGMIGVGWSQVQWLAAALTVGLGFGLQEIFANFVSGLIILLERPVRIGDVVTIGDVTGTVSRIHIRATTITDWDRKEYIVPNKEFVTGRLLNWTLTDKTNRVILRVGVAYGTDTEQAREILLKAAKHHSNVLDDPPPVATFEGFGDSTLNLVLRAYLPSLDNRLGTITELHELVNQGFAKDGIEISFPQLDLNVRKMPED